MLSKVLPCAKCALKQPRVSRRCAPFVSWEPERVDERVNLDRREVAEPYSSTSTYGAVPTTPAQSSEPPTLPEEGGGARMHKFPP